MPLSIGAAVAVRTLGNKPGVVVETGHSGRYRVRVEQLTVWCHEEDLAPTLERKKKKAERRPSPEAASDAQAASSARVDLHGLRVEEAIARVVTEIDLALRRGSDRVEIVHGKGSGRIKDALHRELASMPVVSAFRLDPRNSGVTWAYF
jgi:DNA mismatch repair protein MutS2